jgi:succinate dehydrogenase/fumarate reductase flavoprotein subunit
MDFFGIISEERIKKGYKEGEFENLPGFGKPLPHDELSHVPDDLRMAYRMMKNAGYTEEDNALKQEMSTIEDLIKKCEDPAEKKELQKQLNQKLLQFNSIMSKRRTSTNSSIFKNYENKIHHKLVD